MIKLAFRTTLSLLCVCSMSLSASKPKNQDRNHRYDLDNSHASQADEYDYIIVGCGASGSIIARKLSDDKKNRVLVLEVGINRSADSAVNVASFDLNTITYDPRYAVTYTTPPFAPTGNLFTYTEGRMWGGGTGHHYLNAVRGTPSVYDAWALTSGNSRWSYANLLPTMKSLETYTSNGSPIDPTQRGTSGSMAVTQSSSVFANPVANAMKNVMNIPFVEDYNNANQSHVGVSARQLFVTPGANSQRSWAVPAFLPVGTIVDANGNGLNGRKLKIISDALVSRVLFDKKTATGVECLLEGQEKAVKQFRAKKKVILCAGGINTPAILQRSGIGSSDLLNSLSIPVVYHNPNVGSNMQNHYGVIGFITGATADVIIGFTDMRPYMPADDVRRMQFFAQNVGGQIRIQAWNLDPKSKGSLQIVDVNPGTQPKINFNYYSDGPYTTQGTDAFISVNFYKMIKDIATNLGATVTSPPLADFDSDAKLFADAQIPTNFVITNHMTGTARMAASPSSGVVDGNLHVFGVKNLMVADISVEPVIANGNTCYSAYLIGLTASQIVKGDSLVNAKAKKTLNKSVKGKKAHKSVKGKRKALAAR